MNRRAAIPLVAGLVIGLVAVKLVMDFVKKAQGSQQNQQKFTLVQAKQDIRAYEKIKPEMVQAIETTDSVLATQAERMGTLESVIGRVSLKSIPQNAPILKSMLAPEGTPEGIEGMIPAGYRAVAVKIDEATSAGYNLQPGDWVDVIVVMDIETGVRGKKDTLAETILQRVKIAAIGQGTAEPGESSGTKTKPAKSATILVKQEDAPKLHLAGTRGKITLVLRGSEDMKDDTPAMAFGNDIMAKLGQQFAMGNPTPEPASFPVPEPVVEKAPAPPHTVLVFRGTSQNNKPAAAERVIFESANSWKLIEQGVGTPTGAGALMKGLRSGSKPVTTPTTVPRTETQSGKPDVEKVNDSKEDFDADEE